MNPYISRRSVEFAAQIENFLQILLAGLTLGCTYGLMCTGLGLIFGIMRVTNFAQADFMMLAMYFGWAATAAAVGGFVSLPFYLAVALLSFVVFCAVGAFAYQVVIGRVSGMRTIGMDDSGHTAQLILTLGLSIFIQSVCLMAFGSAPHSIATTMAQQSWSIGPLIGDDVMLFLNKARVLAAAVSLAVLASTMALLQFTSLGRRLRGTADNPIAAIYMGINVNSSHRWAFALGIGITAVAGVMVATYYPFQPYTGFDFVIIMYTGVVLGGMGSVGGAFLGGTIIGLIQQMSTLVLPTQLQNTVLFAVFLLILIVRPRGLFGRNAERA
jgi:branched-chain amino acid transport system permease protein